MNSCGNFPIMDMFCTENSASSEAEDICLETYPTPSILMLLLSFFSQKIANETQLKTKYKWINSSLNPIPIDSTDIFYSKSDTNYEWERNKNHTLTNDITTDTSYHNLAHSTTYEHYHLSSTSVRLSHVLIGWFF